MTIESIDENGVVYWIGENAQNNWDLLAHAKKLNGNWLWFHLDKFSSPYIIACSTISSKQILMFAAQLCKDHSKYKDMSKVSVIYTELKNVKKAEQIGQVTVTSKTKKIVV